jgi:hypothetical protein
MRLLDARTRAEIHLCLFAGSAFHPAEGQRLALVQPPHKTTHARILADKAVIADQVLVDLLGGEAALQLALDDLTPGRAQTGLLPPNAAWLGARQACRADGRPGYL